MVVSFDGKVYWVDKNTGENLSRYPRPDEPRLIEKDPPLLLPLDSLKELKKGSKVRVRYKDTHSGRDMYGVLEKVEEWRTRETSPQRHTLHIRKSTGEMVEIGVAGIKTLSIFDDERPVTERESVIYYAPPEKFGIDGWPDMAFCKMLFQGIRY